MGVRDDTLRRPFCAISNRKTGAPMRKALCATLFAVMLFSSLSAFAQNPNYDVGPVWRVTYYRLKPGQGEAFWKDFRENLKPGYEMVKKEGILKDYKVWTNLPPTVLEIG